MIRGLTGFGSGLLIVPLLLLFLDMKLVVPTAASLALFSGILLTLTFQTRKSIRKDVLPMIVPGAVMGVVLGTYVLATYKGSLLRRLLGLSISGYALKMLFWNREQDGTKDAGGRSPWGIVVGLISGCLGGMFGMAGPPVVMYLGSRIRDKRAFRATLIFYFLVINVWQLATFCVAGLIGVAVLKFVLCLLPAFVIGNLIGSVLHIKVNQALFNRIVALELLITGVFLVL